MKYTTQAAIILITAIILANTAKADIVENIYNGSVNFSGTTFQAIFKYNNQVGNDSATEVTTGTQDPTISAQVAFSDGTKYSLPVGPGDFSEYFVVPGAIQSSDFVDAAGDFLQIGVFSNSAPGSLSTPFTDNNASAFTGTGQFGENFYVLAANSVQVVDNPVSGVPEPSSWAMMLLGFGGLGVLAYRKGQKGNAGARTLAT